MSGIQIPGFNGPMVQQPQQQQLTPDQQKAVGMAIAVGKIAQDIYVRAASELIARAENDPSFEALAVESHRAARAFFAPQDAPDAPQGD